MADDQELSVVSSKPLPELTVVNSKPLPGTPAKPGTWDVLKQSLSDAWDRTGIGQTHQVMKDISDWAGKKSEEAHQENLQAEAHGKPKPHSDNVTGFLGAIKDVAGMNAEATTPKGAAIGLAIAAANTNPITAVPVDTALALHGGYTAVKNLPDALKGDPDAAQRALLGGAEAAGGVAGVRGGAPELGDSIETAKANVGRTVRNPVTNEVHPAAKLATRAAVGAAAHAMGLPGIGELAGALYGGDVADVVLPNNPEFGAPKPVYGPVRPPAQAPAPAPTAPVQVPFRPPSLSGGPPPQVQPQFATEATGTVEDSGLLGPRGKGGAVTPPPKLLPPPSEATPEPTPTPTPTPQPEPEPELEVVSSKPLPESKPAAKPEPKPTVSSVVDQAIGAKPLAPNVPLKDQLPGGTTDPLVAKYPDPMVRQFVRANGEPIVQAVGDDFHTMKAIHDLTRVDLRQALINAGEDMGQKTVSNSKFAGEGSITRQDALKTLLDKGYAPGDIPGLAKAGSDQPNWIYRTRDVGESGLPADAKSHAHATSSLDQAEQYAQTRGKVTGKPQEIVRFDAGKLGPDDAHVFPFDENTNWYKFKRPFPEREVQVVSGPYAVPAE